MDPETKLSAGVQSVDQNHLRGHRPDPAETHRMVLPNPYVPDQSLRGSRSLGLSPKPSNTNGVPAAEKGADVSRSHGYSSSRRVRDSRDTRSTRDPPDKASRGNSGSAAQSRATGKNSVDAQRKGFRGVRSTPSSAGKSHPAAADFEVKLTDFPELAGGSLGGAAAPPLVHKDCWGPTQTPAVSWKSDRRGSPTRPETQQMNARSDLSAAPAGQPVVTSWANVASQPPKKPVPKEKTISSSNLQTEERAAQQEDGAPGKKKRKKKKKKAKGEDTEAEAEEPATYQEPPKFEDEEEFPGLTPALTGADRLTTSSYAAKLCNEENQRESIQHRSADQTKEKSPAGKPAPTDPAKKGQKAEKVSGKKSKVPVQLDIGNMLAALEKKQSQKAKQDAKPLVLSVGGGLPVVQKQPSVQKKPPWQQDKIVHNPLDSTSPLVKKGKQREVPKAKKPTPLKKVILKEREERKQRRLLEERGLLPETELRAAENEAAEEDEEQGDTTATAPDEVASPTEELEDQSELNGTNQTAKEGDEEADRDETVDQQTPPPASLQPSQRKIHSRKFRDYCSQMLSKDVDECVTALLKELVRFQDRLYQKDPMKARMKRRIVMGLREVLKHLKLRKVKCVVISPNCERIQSKGGLDEALYTIIDTCREQTVPFVFALSRKALGRCVNKAVPVSLVGIFNYDGAQDVYHKMIELSSEARRAYEEMVSSLEQTGPAEAEEAANTEEDQLMGRSEEADGPQPEEEPEYIKMWKKMLEKDYNHKFVNFEEQLSSMRLDCECTENSDEEEQS